MKLQPCAKCGEAINIEEKFCPYCGNSTETSYTGISYTARPASTISGKTGAGSAWITIQRIGMWILLIILEVAVVILSFTIMANGSDTSGLGLLILLIGIPIPILSAAKQMMMINNAENLRRIAINTEKTVELLSRKK